MISTFLSRIVILTAGTLYPSYRSYKAVRNKDVKEYVKWMMYWIVFGLFIAGETVADILLSFWFPFYYELKIIFVFWLLSPWTKGASILYRKWVHPTFMKHEEEIDNFLEQAKSESYKQVVSIGSRSLACARDIVATAALRGALLGQEQLVDLHRSYSTGDINLAGIRRTVVTSQKQAMIEEEEEEQEVRTWSGSYDEHGRLVEHPVVIEQEETIKRFDDEDVVIIEDPVASKPRRAGSAASRRSRSRSRTTTISDPSADFSASSNTLPRRTTRSTTRAAINKS